MVQGIFYNVKIYKNGGAPKGSAVFIALLFCFEYVLVRCCFYFYIAMYILRKLALYNRRILRRNTFAAEF